MNGSYLVRQDGIPPAFRGARPAKPSYAGLTDEQVMAMAEAAYNTALSLPAGCRAGAWERFDSAMDEAAARGLRYILGRLREQGHADLAERGLAMLRERGGSELARRALRRMFPGDAS